ncbi:MAG: cell division protein ZapA [Tepidimonas sp.]|uniref:cell division protein ZapA n=1 Tax=Tepidimonas sp. TaxID=2002775 RepID=UPI00259E1BFB|nr:cell division protein ZapA [Tepidimonas sp.]MDM7455752.1 cell division protein ZapA [Tepidimonas sp.]
MSKPSIKQVEVQIMSQTYVLACPSDGEQALREAVAKVDAAMCRIRDAGKVKARDRIAVLAALNIAFDASRQDPSLAFRNSPIGTADSDDAPAADAASALPAEAHEALSRLVARIDSALAADDRLL